jgi:hypothetical protein
LVGEIPDASPNSQRLAVLVGAVLLVVAVLAVAAVDHSMTQSDADAAKDRAGPWTYCLQPGEFDTDPDEPSHEQWEKCLRYRAAHFRWLEEAEEEKRGWERRRVWYGSAAAGLLDLTSAIALVVRGRRRHAAEESS